MRRSDARGLTDPQSDRDTILAIVGGIVALSADPDTMPTVWLQYREPLPGEFMNHSNEAAEDPLIAFFRGGRDASGRTLAEIFAWDDDQLEEVHDYVQWIFPTTRPSDFNRSAPVLTETAIARFRTEPVLRERLIGAFRRMLRFYGFELHDEPGGCVVQRAPNWADRRAEWLAPGDHNLLRITRILDCLSTLGIAAHARAFLHALEEVVQGENGRMIGPRTLQFWRDAVRS